MEIFSSLEKNKQFLKTEMNENKDVVFKEFKTEKNSFLIVYVQDLIDNMLLSDQIIKPLLAEGKVKKLQVKNMQNNVLTLAGTSEVKKLQDCVASVLEGNAVLFINNNKVALKLSVANLAKRAISEPPTSAVIFGPREGFVESLKTNTTLIRKRLQTTALQIEELKVGNYTKTQIRVFYLNDIADKEVVKKIVERLKKIDIDGVIDAHYLISFLEEKKNSIFKQVGKTEKPDILTAKMLEGRVGIMVDGSPIALTLPFILLEDIQNSDDYYQRSFRISFIRIVRLMGIIFSVILPGLYIAIQTQHYRLVPIKFLITLMDSIQGLPFTPMLEMLFVILLFEILYESSLRMPKYLGMALGIVGALILGDTAVKAGLISPPAVMLVALSGISFYTIPEQSSQLSFLRLVFTLAGGMFGMFGIVVLFMFLVSYLNDINSYGSPYLAPYAPRIKEDLYDAIIKKETIALNTRPKSIPSQKKKRLNQKKSVGE